MKNEKVLFLMLLVLIFICSAGVMMLIGQNRFFADTIENRKPLSVGDRFTPLSAVTLNNEKASTLTGKPSLLVFINLTCESCKVSIPLVNAALADIEEAGWQVIGIMGSDEKQAIDYAAEHEIAFPVVADPGRELFRRYKVDFVLSFVPLDAENRITWIHQYGVWTTDALAEIFQFNK